MWMKQNRWWGVADESERIRGHTVEGRLEYVTFYSIGNGGVIGSL